MMQAALLYRNARLATMRAGRAADGDPYGLPYGLIDKGAVAIRGGRILWAGAEAEMPPLRAAETVDLEGRLVTPGLIDCHTHLVYAGDRADEFEKRLQGASYAEIARAGGGVMATVKAVRAASEDDLCAQSLPRLRALRAEGVTTVEIKSGYGLDLENEAKMLRVSARLGAACGVTVRRTYLGAHALPAEYAGDADGYIDDICKHQLPALAAEGLVDAVDAFCEHIGFSPAQVERLFKAAQALGLPVKLHAEQLSNMNGAALAARFGALSADHLEHLDEAGAAAMAQAGAAAILLPGAYYFLRDDTPPPIGLLRKHGVAMAVATDCNPGSSPLSSILLAMNMACVLFGLTPAEALAGATRHAAQALGLGNEIGVIEAGKWADLAIWDAAHPAALAYGVGFNPLYRRLWRGND